MTSSVRLNNHMHSIVNRLTSHYELSGNERYQAATYISIMANRYNKMQELLAQLKDTVEALDGTSIENEKLVDDYRTLMQTLIPE